MSSSYKKPRALEQFDNQRTLLEALRIMAILIWIVYAFIFDPLSDIQVFAFLTILLISILNTAKLASQSIKNKEGSFYSQYVGLLFLFWFFLFDRVRHFSSFEEVIFFGISFESVFQFQKQFLGLALVGSSFIFNFINIKHIVDKNKEKISVQQLYISYSFRTLGLGLFFIAVLTILTWIPYFSDIRFENFNFVDVTLSLGIIFMLMYGITSSNSQKVRLNTLGRMSINSVMLLLVIFHILPNYIELLSGIHYSPSNVIVLNSLWTDVTNFVLILGIIAFIVSSSEPEPRSYSRKIRKKTQTSIDDIKSGIEDNIGFDIESPKKRSKKKRTKVNATNNELKKPVSTSGDVNREEKFAKIIRSSTSNISLERLATNLSFNAIEQLEDWLVDLDLDNLQVNWDTSTLIYSEDLISEVKKFLND